MKLKISWLIIAGIALTLSSLLLPTSRAQRSTAVAVPASSQQSRATQKRSVKGRHLNLQTTGQAPAGEGPAVLEAAGTTITAESCSAPNNTIDPGETVTVSFCIRNSGNTNTPDDLTGTLQATGGVTNPSAPQLYGTVVAGGQPVCKAFTFTAAAQSCGSTITATIQFRSGEVIVGTVNYTFTLGVPINSYSENFDSVETPALPAGWSSAVAGTGTNWVTSTTTPDTSPNDAFTADQSDTGEASLTSPVISITSAAAQLTFRQNYDLESGFDGGVLEIKIGAGSFMDILDAGGSFNNGGYNETLVSDEGCTESPNPLAGRAAWSGTSGGYITTNVTLPATAAGQNIQLRWRAGFDCSVAFTGWRIDTISIAESFACCGAPAPGINLVKLTNGTNNDTPPGPTVPVGSTVTFTYVVTNTGNVPLSGVTVRDDDGTPGNTADDFNATFVGGDTNGNGLLDTTEAWSFTASRIATPGQYTNIGTATGTPPAGGGAPVTSSNPDNHFGSSPGINIVKLTNGTDNNSPPGPTVPVGSTVTFTYVVTNTGSVPLSGVTVRDDNGTPANEADDFNATFVGGDTNGNGLLDTTETWSFTASRIATPGQYTNVGTVTGTVPGPPTVVAATVTDTDVDNHFGANPNVTISIDDVSQAEGNTGTMPFTPFTFTVSLSAASPSVVTVQYKTQNGTANIGYAAEDFLPDMGTVTFNPGEVSKPVTILVNGDTQASPDETFFVNLSNPTNATIADGQGQGTILNDDANGIEPLPPSAFAITNSNQLLSFNIAFPGVILSRVPITGLINGEEVIGIDYRPADGQLYGFTGYNRIVIINTATGATTVVAQLNTGLLGNEYGMDFNPMADRLRLVNDTDQNASVDPATGAVTLQTPLNPGNPNITGAAYTNNFVGATSTTLYDIDSTTDTLYTQSPPSSGTLTPVGPLGVDTGAQVGFDIAPVSTIAYASLSRPLDNAASLYAINLSTGKAHLVGMIGSEPTAIRDISISTIPPPDIIGLTPGNNLVRFNSLTPGTVSAALPITGLINGEFVIGIDYRPADGQLYGYTGYNRVVRINTSTGAATVLGTPASLVGNEYGFDFNPVADRIRLVNDTDQNVRINPNDGTLTATDGTLAYAPGDSRFGQNPNITGAAYTNNFAGATSTTLYDIDSTQRTLVIQNPPNNGTLLTVGDLGVNISPLVGFDIAAGTGGVYAAFQPPLGGFSSLFTINLLTGRATAIGVIGGFESIKDLAVVPAGTFQFNSATAAVAENGGSVTLTVTRTGDSAIASSISFATSDGTATAGSDYTTTSGTLLFNAGETSKTITVPITDNAVAEPAETFTVQLTGATGNNFTGAQRLVTVIINDND